jgi:hypothetical protein
MYLTSQLTTCVENRVVIKVQHCVQSMMFLLCIPHHLVGVTCRVSSIANNLCCVGTISSKSVKKDSKGFKPSKVAYGCTNPAKFSGQSSTYPSG